MLTEETGVDVIIFVFDPSLIQKSQKDSHTYVSFKRGTISSINIKNRIRKDDLGLAGFFWFKNGEIFSKIKNINLIQGQEIVVDHFIQLLLKNNISIKAIKLDHYFHLGTIDELNEFKFWNIIFKKIILILNPITRFFCTNSINFNFSTSKNILNNRNFF